MVDSGEVWWVVKCKSPGCMGALLLDRIGGDLPFQDRLKTYPANEPCPDWVDTCSACGQKHTYGRRDVFAVQTGRSDPGTGSSAFRRARSQIAMRFRTPRLDDRVAVRGRSAEFTICAVRTNPNVVDLERIGPGDPLLNDVQWRNLDYLDEQNEYSADLGKVTDPRTVPQRLKRGNG
jgi:hypothetical protein